MDENLAQAGIRQKLWPDCYVAGDGMIFTPHFDDDGTMTATGREMYDEWMDAQANAIPSV